MIIGFSHHSRGGSGPVLGYLTGYLVNGQLRDPKPEIVRGDPEAVAEIIDSLPFQIKYSSGVLSFAAEDVVTPEIQDDIINRFERAVFAGITADRRCIVWIKHSDKGRTELHFCCSRVDLATGKSLNIAPPTPASRHLLDTLRESINLRYGYRDPGDPAFARAASLPSHIAKLAAQAKRIGKSPQADIREVIAQRLESEARTGRISSRADVIRRLEHDGFTITRAGINYITIVQPGSGERIRLKGNIFRENFCPKDLTQRPLQHDPARLWALERRLGLLVKKRAAFHRARYGIDDDGTKSISQPEKQKYDRTGIPPFGHRAAPGENSPGTRTAIWGDAVRLNEAAQQWHRAYNDLDRATVRIEREARTLTADVEQAPRVRQRRLTLPQQTAPLPLSTPALKLERSLGLELEMELDFP